MPRIVPLAITLACALTSGSFVAACGREAAPPSPAPYTGPASEGREARGDDPEAPSRPVRRVSPPPAAYIGLFSQRFAALSEGRPGGLSPTSLVFVNFDGKTLGAGLPEAAPLLGCRPAAQIPASAWDAATRFAVLEALQARFDAVGLPLQATMAEPHVGEAMEIVVGGTAKALGCQGDERFAGLAPFDKGNVNPHDMAVVFGDGIGPRAAPAALAEAVAAMLGVSRLEDAAPNNAPRDPGAPAPALNQDFPRILLAYLPAVKNAHSLNLRQAAPHMARLGRWTGQALDAAVLNDALVAFALALAATSNDASRQDQLVAGLARGARLPANMDKLMLALAMRAIPQTPGTAVNADGAAAFLRSPAAMRGLLGVIRRPTLRATLRALDDAFDANPSQIALADVRTALGLDARQDGPALLQAMDEAEALVNAAADDAAKRALLAVFRLAFSQGLEDWEARQGAGNPP